MSFEEEENKATLINWLIMGILLNTIIDIIYVWAFHNLQTYANFIHQKLTNVNKY